MKDYLHTLLRTLLPVLFGLIAGSVLASLAISTVMETPASLAQLAEAWSLGLPLAVWGMIIGAVPAFLSGAPLYALAICKGKASYVLALMVGALPGLIMLLRDRTGLAEMTLIFGLSVALCAHSFGKILILHGSRSAS